MAELKVAERKGSLAFYIDGSLQFDTRDEVIYHESLALPAAALAAARFKRPLSALILGGGDGLALREVLKFKEVSSAELVDHDAEVLELGRTAFSAYNAGSLRDPRASVLCADARDFLRVPERSYDIVLADFTFPDSLAGCSLFTAEFFGLVSRVLSRRGIFALNAVSPERFSPAYWAVYKTLRSAGLYPKPLSVDIPSFSAHGYGKWGFFFSSPRAITPRELASLRIPVPAGFLTPEKLRENMRFGRAAAMFGAGIAAPVINPADLLALLNMPAPAAGGPDVLDFFSRSNRALPGGGFPCDPALWSAETLAAWEDSLARILAAFDWDQLLSEAGKLSGNAAARLKDELDEFRAELPSLFPGDGSRVQRVYRVLAALAVLLIMINMAYPDNAFAKGYSSHGSGGGADIVLISKKAASPFHGRVFHTPGIYSGLVPDSLGKMYPKKSFYFRETSPAAGREGGLKNEKAYYALTDNIRLTGDGRAFMLLPLLPYFLKLEAGAFVLFRQDEPEPVFRFRPDPEVLTALDTNIQLQQKALEKARSDRRKWLAWAGPAGALLPQIKAESREVASMLEIKTLLDKAAACMGTSAAGVQPPDRFIKLAPGAYVGFETGAIVFLRDDGDLVSYPMPGLPLYEDAVRLPPYPQFTAFVRALLKTKASTLPPENPARRLGEMNEDDYQRFIGG